MIYTPMTNSRGERVDSSAARARYYGGLRPYILRRSTGTPPASTIGFPSVFRGSLVYTGSSLEPHGKLVADVLIKRWRITGDPKIQLTEISRSLLAR